MFDDAAVVSSIYLIYTHDGIESLGESLVDSTSSRCDSTPRNSAVRLRTLLDVASTRVAEMPASRVGLARPRRPALTAKVDFSTKGCDYIGNKRSRESQVS